MLYAMAKLTSIHLGKTQPLSEPQLLWEHSTGGGEMGGVCDGGVVVGG